MEGEEKEYLSIDSIVSDDLQEQLNFPTEFLNSVTPSGMPIHRLKIKVSATIILLRNLNTKKGLCNGTRFIVTNLKPNLIYAEVLTGPTQGQIVFIPKLISLQMTRKFHSSLNGDSFLFECHLL